MPYAKFEDGRVVYPPYNDGSRFNVHLDAAYCEAHGFTLKTQEEIAAYEAEHAATVDRSIFTKLQIRRAMRALDMEPVLDAILSGGATFAADWSDAQEIDLSDPVFASAIAEAGITKEQIDAVKNKIMEE